VSLGIGLTRAAASRKLREVIEGEGINDRETFITATTGLTFGEQAERWLISLPTRRRRPVKPATIAGWRHSLDKWVLPLFKDRPLHSVSNGALKELVETMAAGGLAPKSIVNHSAVVKLVLASAVDAEGDQLFPRTWNHDFVGMPIVDKTKQRRPTVTEEEVSDLVNRSPIRESVLFSVLAGLGLRIGEGLALRASDFVDDFRVLRVTRSIWKGREQAPKTPAAVRDVDVPEVLAQVLRAFAAGKTGYLFATKSGRPLGQRNALRSSGKSLHAFRRFRTEVLRRAGVPRDLEDLWLGHAPEGVGDLYARGIRRRVEWRREWCERAGIGFSLGLFWAINPAAVDVRSAA
jgi:integrase